MGNGKLLHCSFCGKSQHEVRKLIAGPELVPDLTVFVCDECILLCNDIIRDEIQDAPNKKAELPFKLPSPKEIHEV